MSSDLANIALHKQDLTDEERLRFDVDYNSRKKDPTIAIVLGIFFGYLGIDRFYIGDVGLGVGKLLTLGGCGIWQIIDWFIIMGATEQKNMLLAQEVKQSIVMLRGAQPRGY